MWYVIGVRIGQRWHRHLNLCRRPLVSSYKMITGNGFVRALRSKEKKNDELEKQVKRMESEQGKPCTPLGFHDLKSLLLSAQDLLSCLELTRVECWGRLKTGRIHFRWSPRERRAA